MKIREKKTEKEKENTLNVLKKIITSVYCVRRCLKDDASFVIHESEYANAVRLVIYFDETIFFTVNYFVTDSVEVIFVSRSSKYSTMKDIPDFFEKSYLTGKVSVVSFSIIQFVRQNSDELRTTMLFSK